MSDDPYIYPGSAVLVNLFDIRDANELAAVERQLVSSRQWDGCPTGTFDLNHLRSIHHHLFQDVYAWAGEVRTVEIAKGDSVFQARSYIDVGMADVHSRLVKADFLKGLNEKEFANGAGPIIGDVNYVHPINE